jgi:hypothetical protein
MQFLITCHLRLIVFAESKRARMEYERHYFIYINGKMSSVLGDVWVCVFVISQEKNAK